MASFSDTHPFAYHIFPLTAARCIWKDAALRGKDDLGASTPSRRTTGKLDRLLGFSGFVHFYLPRKGTAPEELPILSAQLKPSSVSPCPHAMVAIPTASLRDEDLTICNWNIAVSRPAVPGSFKGGNWTRGTDPEVILKAWQTFRASRPAPEKARGFWGEHEVPTLVGPQIKANLRLLRLAPRKMPELLLQSPACVLAGATITVFSRADIESLRRIGPPPNNAALQLRTFSGYDPNADCLGPRRSNLDEYLAGRRETCPEIDFDAIRPASS